MIVFPGADRLLGENYEYLRIAGGIIGKGHVFHERRDRHNIEQPTAPRWIHAARREFLP